MRRTRRPPRPPRRGRPGTSAERRRRALARRGWRASRRRAAPPGQVGGERPWPPLLAARCAVEGNGNDRSRPPWRRAPGCGIAGAMPAPKLFDRALIARRLDRAIAAGAADFLLARAAEDLAIGSPWSSASSPTPSMSARPARTPPPCCARPMSPRIAPTAAQPRRWALRRPRRRPRAAAARRSAPSTSPSRCSRCTRSTISPAR